jgi:hemerythrin-like metal-binding protein
MFIDIHFRNEENILKSTEYVEFDAHKVEHEVFRIRMETFRDKRKRAQDTKETEIALRDFVFRWLLEHIMVVDRAYVPHLRKVRG